MALSFTKVCLVFGLACVAQGVVLSREAPTPWLSRNTTSTTRQATFQFPSSVIDIIVQCPSAGAPASVTVDGYGTTVTEEFLSALKARHLELKTQRLLDQPGHKLFDGAHVCEDGESLYLLPMVALAHLLRAPVGAVLGRRTILRETDKCLTPGDTANATWTDVDGTEQSTSAVVGSTPENSNFALLGNCFGDTFRYTQFCFDYDVCCVENHGSIEFALAACFDESLAAMVDMIFGWECDQPAPAANATNRAWPWSEPLATDPETTKEPRPNLTSSSPYRPYFGPQGYPGNVTTTTGAPPVVWR